MSRLTKHLVSPQISLRRSRQFNQLTAPLRMTPNFIIIGGMKCGTSSLYEYLRRHPNVKSGKKELFFFDTPENLEKGIIWYKSHFPISRNYFPNSQQEYITGEATPDYIFSPIAPKNIADTIPSVKLIVLLRNPVDRAYSHYHHSCRYDVESASFEEAIELESSRLCGESSKGCRLLPRFIDQLYNENFGISKWQGFQEGPNSEAEKQKRIDRYKLHNYSYLSRGIYIDQLKRWFTFFSRKQFLIINSEDFYANTQEVFERVLEFLDLPRMDLVHRIHNSNSYSKMLPETRKSLINYFKPHNERLYEYLDVKYDWDK